MVPFSTNTRSFKIELDQCNQKSINFTSNIDDRQVLDPVIEKSHRRAPMTVEKIISLEMDDFLRNYPESIPLAKKSPFNEGDIIELDILSLSHSGQGLAIKYNWVVTIPFVLPGERVSVRIYKNHASHSVALLENILESSKQRQPAACKYFGLCNSCQFQHMPYVQQLQHKMAVVRDVYSKVLGKPLVEAVLKPISRSPKEYEYRSKMTPHFQKLDFRDKCINIGYNDVYERVMDIDACPLVVPELTKRYRYVREAIFKTIENFKQGATLLLRRSLRRNSSPDLDGDLTYTSGTSKYTVVTENRSLATELVAGHFVTFPAGAFFQVNPWMLDRCIAIMKNEIKSIQSPDLIGSSGIQSQIRLTNLIDAYCGSGVFALTLSSLFKRVCGIEIDKQSTALATANAKFNQIRNAEFIVGDVSSLFRHTSLTSMEPDETIVLMDPPRSGCSVEFLEQLLQFSPRAILYMSCYPLTQAVDVSQLVDGNQYIVHSIQPMDFFPQTSHVECLVTLLRKDVKDL